MALAKSVCVRFAGDRVYRRVPAAHAGPLRALHRPRQHAAELARRVQPVAAERSRSSGQGHFVFPFVSVGSNTTGAGPRFCQEVPDLLWINLHLNKFIMCIIVLPTVVGWRVFRWICWGRGESVLEHVLSNNETVASFIQSGSQVFITHRYLSCCRRLQKGCSRPDSSMCTASMTTTKT